MKKIIKVFLLIGLIFNLAQQAESQRKNTQAKNSKQKTLTAEQIADKFLPSIVLIVCDNGKGNFSQGSGFFIRQGMILTNYHVIESMSRGKVKIASEDNKAKEWWIDKILYTDSKSDLALLSIIETDKKKTPTLSLSVTDKTNIGEAVYVLSNPKGLTGTISQGIVSSRVRKTEDNELLQIDAPISSGSSGGAVLNVRGEVVGIATSSLSSGQNLNFAIPSASIKSFLKTYDSSPIPLTYSNKPKMPNGWLSVLRKPVIAEESISDNESQETSSGSQTTKTEEKPKVTYEEITQDLATKLKGSKFKNSEKSIQTVSNISFTGCSINVKTAWIMNDEITYKSYNVNLNNLKDVSFTSFSREITMSVNLEFSRNIVERTEFGWFEAPFSASLTKSIRLPVTIDYPKAIKISKQFEQLKGLCSDTQNTSNLTLKETTDWIIDKVEGTKSYTTDFIFKYERLKFSQCDMTLIKRSQFEGSDSIYTYQANLKFLRKVEAAKNVSGNWGVWLEFGSNFDVNRETLVYFGKKESFKEDKITMFFDDSEKAKRVGYAFARLLELCSEETKEAF